MKVNLSILLILLFFSCHCQPIGSDFNRQLIKALIYDTIDTPSGNETEKNLILSIALKNSSTEKSGQALISAKEAILIQENNVYDPYLSLAEGYFHIEKDIKKSEELFLEALKGFKKGNNTEMSFLSNYFLVRLLTESDQWRASYNSYNRFIKSFESESEDFKNQDLLELISKNMLGTILTALSSQDSTIIPRAKAELNSLIAYSNQLKADAQKFNAIGNLAFVYFLEGEYNKMIPLAKEDLDYSIESGKTESACGLHIILSSAYDAIGNDELALFHFKEAEKLIPKVTSLYTTREFLKNAQKFYDKNDFEKVLELMESFSNLLIGRASSASINDYEYYIAESKLKDAENQINFLKERNKWTKRNNWLLGLLLATVFLLFIIFYKLHNNQRSFRRKLEDINQNLEAEVKSRTKKVYEQNEKIRAFSFQNSHKTRAPVARLIGLADLLSDDPESNQELLKEIKTSTTEIDEVIRKINEILADDTSKSFK